MNKKAKYICIEGVEGVGKGTQTALLIEHLIAQGLTVINTKEPGTDRVPVTQQLRALSLDGQYSKLMKGFARELIFQSIRTIHLNHDVYPNLNQVDYIIQDRGIASGLAYGMAFGMDLSTLIQLNNISVLEKGREYGINSFFDLYDNIIFFQTNQTAMFLEKAKNAKQEFKAGDGIEAEGAQFMDQALINFTKVLPLFKKVSYINVQNKNGEMRTIKEIFEDVLSSLC